jgi:hypothetical protein
MGRQIGDDPATQEVVELAILDQRVAFIIEHPRSLGLISASSLELAPLDEGGGHWHLVDAWDLPPTIVTHAVYEQRTALEIEHATLDQNETHDLIASRVLLESVDVGVDLDDFPIAAHSIG